MNVSCFAIVDPGTVTPGPMTQFVSLHCFSFSQIWFIWYELSHNISCIIPYNRTISFGPIVAPLDILQFFNSHLAWMVTSLNIGLYWNYNFHTKLTKLFQVCSLVRKFHLRLTIRLILIFLRVRLFSISKSS